VWSGVSFATHDLTLKFLLILTADGNLNEDNICAFGVGFYSLFSVTE
jgi:HSP90 family molecular chaperone